MKISIVTAVRNAESTIASTLRSVAAQNHPDVEHIVVDGASTDGTLKIVAAHSGSVSRLLTEPDKGVYEAFNKGLRLATGEVVGYLNSGDEYTSVNCVKAVAGVFASRPEVDVVFGDVLIVDPATARLVRVYRASRFSPGRLGGGFMPGHPGVFIRRSAYLQYGGYDESYRIAGDFELVARLLGRHGLRYSYLEMSLVRMITGGLSTANAMSNWIISREMHRACVTNGIRTSWPRLFSRFPRKYFEMRPSGTVAPTP